MRFNGFSAQDFNVFSIEGLKPRMEAIRARIQPKFKAIGEALADEVSMMAGTEMFLHIAQHARRTVNPPKDTWLSFSHDKRGYKKHPHFQIGLFDDRVFIWLAYINELANKREIAQQFLKHADIVRNKIPPDYLISTDHTDKQAVRAGDLTQSEFEDILKRFRDIKKAEFLVGCHISSDDPVLKQGDAFLNKAKETLKTLMPLYRMEF